jgi:hypothetical protein
MIGKPKDWKLCRITLPGDTPPSDTRRFERHELNGIAYVPTMTSFLIKGDEAEIYRSAVVLKACFEGSLKRCAVELFYSEWSRVVELSSQLERPRKIAVPSSL